MDPTAIVLIFVELLNKVDQQLPRKTSPLYKIGKFRHLLAYIGRFVFLIREPGRLYQNRESPGEIGRLDRYATVQLKDLWLQLTCGYNLHLSSVWRNGMFYKLLNYNIRGFFYDIIKKMYQNTKSMVKCGNKYSQEFDSFTGLKQGDNISPMLFNLYINDLPDIFDNTCDPPKLGIRDVNCLCYADDLVIISESPQGLQQSLNKLQLYCKKWKLNINVDKTKILVMSKGTKKEKFKFYLGDEIIEIVQCYTYLGVKFAASGTFKYAQKELGYKALKAIFKLKKDINNTNISPKLGCKLFDQLIKPIMTYGCEIWGAFPNYSKIENCIKTDCYLSEKYHIKMCKYLLGVPSRATNNGVLAELGRYPLYVGIILKAIKCYIRLLQTESNSLLYQAFIDSCILSNNGKESWVGFIRKILYENMDNNILNIMYSDITNINIDYVCNHVKSNLITQFKDKWRKEISFNNLNISNIEDKQPKLRTYSLFKSEYKYEPYLDIIKDPKKRFMYTKFRISAHDLNIEKQRYVKPRIPPSKRLCEMCNLKKVEDEFHVLFHCTKYTELRLKYITSIPEYNLLLNNNLDLCVTVSDKDKLNTIMNSVNKETIISVANFIFDMNILRKKHL